MRHLIDNYSHSSEDKKTIVHKMVNKDDVVGVIINIAVEMEASVEYIKQMLLDSCL